MSSRPITARSWTKLGCFGLVGWFFWVAVSTAAPGPMLALNGLGVFLALLVLVLPVGRHFGASIASRLGSPVWVLGVGLLLVSASGTAMAVVGLVRPPTQPEVQADAPDVRETPTRAGNAQGGSDQDPAVDREAAERVEAEAEPDTAEPSEQAEVERPSDAELEVDAEVSREIDRRPTEDAYARVARRRRTSRDDVLEAVTRVGEYRNHLSEDVGREAGRGVTGRVQSQGVSRSDLGAMTAVLSVTVVGCPDNGRLPDQDLDFLARTALTRIAQNISTLDVDGFRASLWYEGVGCSKASLGYGATWQREGNRLRLR